MKNLYLFLTFKFIINFIAVALVLFLSAGSLNFPQGILLLALGATLALVYISFMLKNKKELFKKRLIYKETNKTQQLVIVLLALVGFMVLFLSGISFRFSLLQTGNSGYIFGSALFLLSAFLYLKVIKINSFVTSEVTVEENQKVVTSGPYKLIRHPMYLALTLAFLGIGLFLGSLLSLFASLLVVPVLSLRIANEEKLLKESLKGYKEYMNKTKYRLIPYIF